MRLIWKFQQLSNFPRAIILAIISGLIIWLSFNFHFLWVFAIIAILPLLYVHYNLNLKAWQDVLVGSIAGTIMAAGVMSWHWELLPVDWAGITNQSHGIILILYVWGLSSVMGGLIGLWSLGIHYLKRNTWFDFLLIPALWVIAEFIRSIAISILWSGDGGLIGPHWTIAFQGYTLASSKLFLPLASIGGVYLLSFVVIFINVVIYAILNAVISKSNWKRHWKPITILIIIAIVVAVPFYSRGVDQKVKVGVVNTYLDSFSRLTEQEFLENLEIKKALLQTVKNSGQNPDIVIYPEDSRVLTDLQASGDQLFLKDIFGNKEVLIVDSTRLSDNPDEAAKLQFLYLNTLTGKLINSDKQFLVPHGEYLPYLSDKLLKLSGLSKWADGFRASRISNKGKDIKTVSFQDFRLGASACSEAMSVSLNRNMVDLGTAFLINAASHSLFNGSEILYAQTINISKVRAVENNRYFVQASNFVPSFILDNKGNMIVKSDWFEDTIIYEDVGIIRGNSIYNQFGRFLVPILLIIIVLLAFVKRYLPNFLMRLDI